MSDVSDVSSQKSPRSPEVGEEEVIDVGRVELEAEVLRLRREVADLGDRPPPSPRRSLTVRRVATWVFAVLTAIAVAAAAVGVWLRGTILDTDEFMSAVQPALESPEVAEALSVRLTDETLAALNLEQRLGDALDDVGGAIFGGVGGALDLTPAQQARIQALPLPGLDQLAGPIAAGLETRIAARVDEFVTSDGFRTLLVDLTRQAHTRAVALLRGDFNQLPNVVVESGEVRLDLVPAVARVLSELVDEGLGAVGIDNIPVIEPSGDPEVALNRLSQALGVQLDPGFGKFTVMSQAELQELQGAVRLVDRLVWGLVVVALALAAVTISVAPKKRRGLLQATLAAAVGVTVGMLLIRNTQDEIASVASTPQGEGAIRAVAASAFDSLRSVMLFVLVVALAVALVTYLLGRPPWVERSVAAVRRTTRSQPEGSDLVRFVAAHHDAVRIGTIVVAIGVLALTGITLLSLILVAGAVLAVLGAATAASNQAASLPAEDAAPVPSSPGPGEA